MKFGDPRRFLDEAEQRKNSRHEYIAVVLAHNVTRKCRECSYVGQLLGLAQEIALGLLRLCVGLLVAKK